MKRKKTSSDEQRSAAISNLSGFMIGKKNKQDKFEKGSVDFSLGNLFKCVCCIHSGISYEEKRLNEINESLQQINKRLNLLDRFVGFIIYNRYETQSSRNIVTLNFYKYSFSFYI